MPRVLLTLSASKFFSASPASRVMASFRLLDYGGEAAPILAILGKTEYHERESKWHIVLSTGVNGSKVKVVDLFSANVTTSSYYLTLYFKLEFGL